MRQQFALSTSLVIALVAPASASPISLADINDDLSFIETQVGNTAAALTPGNYPLLVGQNGAWLTRSGSYWTSGFFPGELWLLYQATGSLQWRSAAESWTAPLASEASAPRSDYLNVGFIIGESFGNGYRLTGNSGYEKVILDAAKSLAAHYNPKVGAMQSEAPLTIDGTSVQFPVIIDNMMTLGPLQWGATHGGDSSWEVDAAMHAETTMAQLVTTTAQPNRPVGSTYQLANFDPTTGEPASPEYYQTGGLSPTSVWSRGEAWGLYGFVQAYQATGNPEFLLTAEEIANFFFSHLPSDYVPYWDFDAPVTPTTPRDTSAAAIAADGLVMLSSVVGGSLKTTYLTEAEDIFGSLSSSYLDQNGKAVLTDGSYNVPGNFGVDTPVIWGDYFFTEGLLRLRNDLEGLPPWTLYNPGAPEPSSWAMVLIGFAGLGLAGYRASRQRAAFAT